MGCTTVGAAEVTSVPTATAKARATLHRPDLRIEKELLRNGCTRLAAIDEVGRGALAGPVTVGAVVVTARIGRVPPGLRDSKLLTPLARQALVPMIQRWVVEYAVGHAWPEEIDRIGVIGALRLAGRRALGALTGPVDAVLLDGNHDYLTEPAPGLFDPEDIRQPDADPEPEAPPRLASAPPQIAPPQIVPPQIARPRPLLASPVPTVHPAEGLVTVPALVHTRIKADLTCAAVAGASVLAKTERDALLVDLDAPYPPYQFAVNKGYGTPEHLAALRRHGPTEVHRRSWRLPGAWSPGEE